MQRAVGRELFVQEVFGKSKFSGIVIRSPALVGETRLVALRSALEDFEDTSLCAIPGLLGKLRYIAELHDGRGSYSHWGMARVHGEAAARRAIRTSHAAVFARVLRTPLRGLADDLICSSSSAQVSAVEFLSSLEKMTPQVLPDRSEAASQKHLTAMLHALLALAQNPARASHPDASPPPLPVR